MFWNMQPVIKFDFKCHIYINKLVDMKHGLKLNSELVQL